MNTANAERIKFDKWPTAAMVDGWLFGHYDSRGGAVLVEEAHILPALKTYLGGFFAMPADEINDDAFDMAHEDLIGRRTFVFLGTEQPERGGELLGSYRDEGGWEAFKLEMHYSDGGEWFENETYVILLPVTAADRRRWERGEDDDREGGRARRVKAETWAKSAQYRLRPWDLGEDACGLVWVSPEAASSGESSEGGEGGEDKQGS